MLASESIVLGGTATSRDAAITEAGQLLVASGAVDPTYVDAMHERETSVSTHMGNGLAIPHGTNEAKSLIRQTAISFVRYDDPIDWNGKPAEFVLGIAGAATTTWRCCPGSPRPSSTRTAARLRDARTPEDVLAVLDVSGAEPEAQTGGTVTGTPFARRFP